MFSVDYAFGDHNKITNKIPQAIWSGLKQIIDEFESSQSGKRDGVMPFQL